MFIAVQFEFLLLFKFVFIIGTTDVSFQNAQPLMVPTQMLSPQLVPVGPKVAQSGAIKYSPGMTTFLSHKFTVSTASKW